MGFKRPFDDEKFHELPLKHSRQLGYSEKSSQFGEFIPNHDVSQKFVATVNERDLCKPQGGESSDGETFDKKSNFDFPGHNMDGSFTWVIEGCDGKDATLFPHPVKYFELGIPPIISPLVETFDSFLLDQPPRKQVPIGPGHQAIVPEWEGSLNGNLEPFGMSVQNHIVGQVDGEKLFGTCIIPMPALNTLEDVDCMVGKGRDFCVCEDRGSIRCVCQHIKEAREEMVKILGFEKFRDLGFCDMGEEVEQSWSDEEALLFHEIVYSNPMTLGQNFWKNLEAAFCSQTKNEIVSYYFNVFVLRRRATQNRTLILDIDSDDDEWQEGYGGHLGIQYVEEDEEYSAIESPLHQGANEFDEKVHPLYHKDGEEDASNSRDDEGAYVDTIEGGPGLHEEQKMNATVEYMDMTKDDSCKTLELTHDAVNSGWMKCGKKDETGHEEYQKKLNDPMYTGKDLKPAQSIMEEILSGGSWEKKANNK